MRHSREFYAVENQTVQGSKLCVIHIMNKIDLGFKKHSIKSTPKKALLKQRIIR